MITYFILLNGKQLGPLTAAEAARLHGFAPETPVKYAGSEDAGWIAACTVPELAIVMSYTAPPAPGCATGTETPGIRRKALASSDEELDAWMRAAREELDGFFRNLRDNWEEEKKRAGAALEKKLDREISAVYAGIRGRVEQEAAAKLKEFSDLAAAELDAARRGVQSELGPKWEKLAADTAAEFDDSLRRLKEFNARKQREIEGQVRKHTESLSPIMLAELSRKAQQFTDDLQKLADKLRDRAEAELAKKLGGEIVPASVYEELRRRIQGAAAEKVQQFTDMGAAELEAGRAAAMKELAAGWERFSAEASARLDESLNEYRRKKEEEIGRALVEHAGGADLLRRETQAKIKTISADVQKQVEDIKAWMTDASAELARIKTAAEQAKAATDGIPAAGGLLEQRLLQLEKKFSKEILERKRDELKSEIPVIIRDRKNGPRGEAGAAPLYTDKFSLKENITLAAALGAAAISLIALLAK